jgi:hypothetical protein
LTVRQFGGVQLPTQLLRNSAEKLIRKGETSMNERSKTNMEIFEQKYPFKELAQNPILCAEANGYLKALIQYLPCEQKWVDSKMSELVLIMLFFTLE